jgi:hypothetical protein
MWVHDPVPYEVFGAGATLGELTRFGGDTSQPLTVTLTSSDESEILVPESVTFPANETSVTFPIDALDDDLLDGEQWVLITATAGPDFTDAQMIVQDYETADVEIDQSEVTSGTVLTGTVTVSVTGHTEPISVPLISTRPDEIASIVVEVPVGEQTASFAIPVTGDAFAEGPHAVHLSMPLDFELFGDFDYLSVADLGVNTLQPLDDGHARDADQDGLVFEQLTLNSTQVTTQAATSTGSFGEARGIFEFDVASIPDGAVIQSAVLTVEVQGQSGTTPMDIDFFAFLGNGSVETIDATQAGTAIGQLTTTPGIEGLKSVPVVLDAGLLQSLVESGDFVGFVSKVAPAFASTGRYVSVASSEYFLDYFRPSLHLVWTESGSPVLSANSLTIQEGHTVIITAGDLAATDSDSDESALVFTVSNVTRGQFLVNGSPETSFTQAEIAAGAVAFVHDSSELAPDYALSVSDGTINFGPQAATINFINLNDELPIIVPGQVFDVSESSVSEAVVGSVAFSDGDLPGDSFSFLILAGNDDGVFEIDDTGLLTVRDETALDYETTASYVLTIAVSDGADWTSENITVNVIDEVEIAPLLTIDYTEFHESLGSTLVTMGHVSRVGEDLSQPWTVILTSSVEAKLNLPAEVYIPAYETTASFPIGVNDDTLLTGPQVVTVTAMLVGGGASSVDVTVLDVETVAINFAQTTGSPGNSLNATVSVSSTNRTEPLTILLESTRPNEIAPISIVLDPSQQSVVVPVPILADSIAEGLHGVKVTVSAPGHEGDGSILAPPGHTKLVEISDPGVVTVFAVADTSATDADQDGNVFEQLDSQSHAVFSQAAAADGSVGETRGILEFDLSEIPAGAIIESAVLTLDVFVAWDYVSGDSIVMDVFAYQGNGLAESADANQIVTNVGQLTVDTDSSTMLASYPIVLDKSELQSLADSGGYAGIVTTMQDSLLQYFSNEYIRVSSKPALHLVLAHPPALTADSLSLNEGATVTLSASDLAATDADSDNSELVFTATNVSRGQFLVSGSPATSFTQAQISAGQVAFVHDGSEMAPAFAVSVSDGTYSDGPISASISFTHVNDNAPVIPAGQAFSISENTANGSVFGDVTFSDVDLPGDTLSASIVGGNIGGVFRIDNAGILSVADNTNLDFESTTTYSLTVRAFDGVNTTDQLVTVNVLNVAETKFYVVNDASANRTYEYDADGTSVEDYVLSSDNSAPRGAASTAAGDRMWVVDDDRKVYVYDASGALLGSWTAGSMSSSATPEGIATDGTDVWIVDGSSDRVYRYAGAATRLSGSQIAADNFRLNSGNRAPKDIVTDGTSLWVVNDASTNKVFKYTVDGSLLGSWTIDSANSKPTGLTIDPADVSDIWIVDSSTDRVYQYTGATTRISGSHSASATFALAAGNSDPQGIADPPPVETLACGSAEDLGVHEDSAGLNAHSAFHMPSPKSNVKRWNASMAREQAFATLFAPRAEFLSRPMPRPAFAETAGTDRTPKASNHSEQAVVDLALELISDSVALPNLNSR